MSRSVRLEVQQPVSLRFRGDQGVHKFFRSQNSYIRNESSNMLPCPQQFLQIVEHTRHAARGDNHVEFILVSHPAHPLEPAPRA